MHLKKQHQIRFLHTSLLSNYSFLVRLAFLSLFNDIQRNQQSSPLAFFVDGIMYNYTIPLSFYNGLRKLYIVLFSSPVHYK